MPAATRTRAAKAQPAAKLETMPLRGVEVLAPGTWNGDAYTVDDLVQMAATFAAGNAGIVPPAKLGHNPEQQILARDGLPAAGYVERLYVDGDRLKADFRDVPKRLAALIRSKAYSKVSAEVYFNLLDPDSGKRIPRVLKAISFLGADVPAVTSLADIEALYGAGAEAVAAYYSDVDATVAGRDGELRVYELPADMSFDSLREALREALRARLTPAPMPGMVPADKPYVWITDVFEDYAIAEVETAATGSRYFRVDYTVGDDGAVTLAEAMTPVRRAHTWTPVAPATAMGLYVSEGTADESDGDEDFGATLAALLERMEARHKGAKGMPALRTFAREMRSKLAVLRRTTTMTPASYSRQAEAQEEPMNPELLQALGLAEGADDATALAKVRELTAALETANTAVSEAKRQIGEREGQYASMEEYRALQSEVGKLTAELSRRDALAEVERAVTAGKVLPAQRAWAEAYAAKDIDGFRAYTASAPAFPLGQTAGASGARPDGGSTVLSETDRTVARQLGMAEEKLLAFKEKQSAR